MKTKKIVYALRILIAVFFLVGLFMVGFYYPYLFQLIQFGSERVAMTNLEIVELITFWVLSIPCFVILLLSIKLSSRFAKEQLFTVYSAKLIKYAGIILCADSALLLIGSIIFTCLKGLDIEAFFILLSLVGVSLAILLLAVGDFLLEGNRIKKENEEII